MEILDIYNEHMEYIGQAPRSQAHAQGLWHKTFQCWIVTNEEAPSFLFQKRSPTKDVFPNLLDKSCGGHLTAGETIADGVRELEEELGLIVPFEHLTPCGIIEIETSVSTRVMDREFCYVFLYETNQPLEAYRLQAEEVSGLYRVAIDDYFALLEGEKRKVWVSGLDYSGTTRTEHNFWATVDDFTPEPQKYLDLLKNSLHQLDKK